MSQQHLSSLFQFFPFKRAHYLCQFILINALIFTTCSLSAAESTDKPASSLNRQKVTATAKTFSRFVKREYQKEAIPGVALAVVYKGETILIDTYGRRIAGHKEKIDEHTIFRLASVSKTFAAELTAMLVAEGKLNWNDPITKYVPEFKLANNREKQLTIHHVLSHSTGLVPYAFDNLLNANQSLDKILPKFDKIKPICNPGRCYGYQNIVYSLVEPALESTSGQTYENLLHKRIFFPLEMKDASVGLDPWQDNDNRTSPHVEVRGRARPVKVKESYYQIAPAAGVNASITDLSKWLHAQMGYHEAVIPQHVIETVTTPTIRTRQPMRHRNWRKHLKDAHYGLGWRIYDYGDNEIVYHGGYVSGFRASVAWSPEHEVGVAILLNAESNAISHFMTRFWEALLIKNKKKKKR